MLLRFLTLATAVMLAQRIPSCLFFEEDIEVMGRDLCSFLWENWASTRRAEGGSHAMPPQRVTLGRGVEGHHGGALRPVGQELPVEPDTLKHAGPQSARALKEPSVKYARVTGERHSPVSHLEVAASVPGPRGGGGGGGGSGLHPGTRQCVLRGELGQHFSGVATAPGASKPDTPAGAALLA